MSVNLYNKETKTLTQVAGSGDGVAKFGTPVSGWLASATSTATAVVADSNGILVIGRTSGGSAGYNIYEDGVVVAYITTSTYNTTTIVIRKGHKYHSDGGGFQTSTFYPFVENIVKPIEGGEEYSTDETVIGTWIDGKKLYRKVAFISNFTTTTYSAASLGINNVDTMVTVDGFLTNSTYSNIRTGGFFASGYSVVVVYKSNGDFQTELRGFASGKFTLIAEYTKTTD